MLRRSLAAGLLLGVAVISPAYAQLVTISPAQGPKGDTGNTGATGSTGAAATIAVGTVTTLSPGASATVANGGSSSAAIFNFGIPQGATGASGANAIGSPATRSLSAGTAVQASDPTKPALVALSLTSTATLSLSGGTTNTATVYVGGSGVGTSGGTAVCSYANTNTGALTIGLNLSTVATQPCTFGLPTGSYFAFRVSAGTVTAALLTDSSVG